MSKRDKKNKQNMKAIKEQYYAEVGHVCWLCQKHFTKHNLTGHHVIPFRVCKDTIKNNIVILCYNCHFGRINYIPYPSQEYNKVMTIIWEFYRERSKQNV
jgi:5-methylcytosine-specific restriction endonuclease McrA